MKHGSPGCRLSRGPRRCIQNRPPDHTLSLEWSRNTGASGADGIHATADTLDRTHDRADHVREGLARPRSVAGKRGIAGRAVCRPAPDPRSHLAAGLRAAQGARAEIAPAGTDARDARSRGADRDGPGLRRPADPARGRRAADRRARAQRARIRLRASRPSRRAARHRARDRPRARADATRHDDRLRRQPHEHAWRIRRAGFRHRHDGSRPRLRDAVPAATEAENARHRHRGPACDRRRRERSRARTHQPYRRRRRRAAGHRVPRKRHP